MAERIYSIEDAVMLTLAIERIASICHLNANGEHSTVGASLDVDCLKLLAHRCNLAQS